MGIFVVGAIWLMIGVFGFVLLDIREAKKINFISFVLFLAIVPVPIILYSIFALFSVIFTGSFAGLNLKG